MIGWSSVLTKCDCWMSLFMPAYHGFKVDLVPYYNRALDHKASGFRIMFWPLLYNAEAI